MAMQWKYRTILFEFAKDGLLGDHYLNDEEIENTLNEQGADGWELVNVTLLQDGLLAVMKRSAEAVKIAEVSGAGEREETDQGNRDVFSAEQLQQQERDYIRTLEKQRRQAMEQQEQDLVGEIRIR